MPGHSRRAHHSSRPAVPSRLAFPRRPRLPDELPLRNQYLRPGFAGGPGVWSAMQPAMKASFSGCLRAGLTCSAWAKQKASTSGVAAKAGVISAARVREAMTALIPDFRFIVYFLQPIAGGRGII